MEGEDPEVYAGFICGCGKVDNPKPPHVVPRSEALRRVSEVPLCGSGCEMRLEMTETIDVGPWREQKRRAARVRRLLDDLVAVAEADTDGDRNAAIDNLKDALDAQWRP